MGYEGTAARKRPKNFEEIVGQEFVTATLSSSVAQGRIAHAYLFSGPRGVGKTSAARVLAKALNCAEGPRENPCGQCGSCLEITKGNSLDVIEIDGASNTSVNDVREIREEVLFAPNSSRFKVYIIDEVHMLSNSAFNALLKTIEEPPPYIVFIFATTEVHKVPATIRSRCQQYSFRLVSTGEIKRKLREAVTELGVEAEDRALIWIAKEATGSLRDAFTLVDQVVSFCGKSITLDKIREKLGILGIDEMNELAGRIVEGDLRGVLAFSDQVMAKGISVDQFVADLAEYFRNVLFVKSGVTKDTILGYTPEDFNRDVVAALSVEQIEKSIEILLSLHRNIRFSQYQRFEFELALSRLSGIGRFIGAAEIRESLDAVRKAVAAGPGVRIGPALTAPVREQQSVEPARAAPEPTPTGGPREAEVDIRQIVQRVADSLKREKPGVFSALEKCVSVEWEPSGLVLKFAARDRFSGELVLSEKEIIAEKLSKLLSKPAPINIVFLEPAAEGGKVDPRAGLLLKVFRGEIVKGEAHDG
jgi:DNA polymerase III subunit gamma/tau